MKVLSTDSSGFNIGEQQLVNIHGEDQCTGKHCVIHRPSRHHMRKWKLLWRQDKRMFERICKHGVGHPDPDDLAFHVRNGREYIGVHGCEGCCATRRQRVEAWVRRCLS